MNCSNQSPENDKKAVCWSAYHKKYYAENRVRILPQQKRWRTENAETLKTRLKESYAIKKERIARCQKRYDQKNKEYVSNYQRQYCKNNREGLNGYCRGYYAKNTKRIRQILRGPHPRLAVYWALSGAQEVELIRFSTDAAPPDSTLSSCGGGRILGFYTDPIYYLLHWTFCAPRNCP